MNYVEPKIRLENGRLESLRSQKADGGDTGKEAKRLAKEVERQEDFLSELRDFEDKLRRAANLHLEPDPNDGVVLTSPRSMNLPRGRRRSATGTNSSKVSTIGPPSASNFARKDW